MAKYCMVCGKTPKKGKNVSHSNRKSNRRFNPNIRSARISSGNNSLKLSICSKCLRTVKKVRNSVMAEKVEVAPTEVASMHEPSVEALVKPRQTVKNNVVSESPVKDELPTGTQE